jgi:hypothetical protein
MGWQKEVMEIAWGIMKNPISQVKSFSDCLKKAWRIVLERESDGGNKYEF